MELLFTILWALDTFGFQIVLVALGNEGARGIFGQSFLPANSERYGAHHKRGRLNDLTGVAILVYFLPHPLFWRDKLEFREGFEERFISTLCSALAEAEAGEFDVLKGRLETRLPDALQRMIFGFRGWTGLAGARLAPKELREEWCKKGGRAAMRAHAVMCGLNPDDEEDCCFAMQVGARVNCFVHALQISVLSCPNEMLTPTRCSHLCSLDAEASQDWRAEDC